MNLRCKRDPRNYQVVRSFGSRVEQLGDEDKSFTGDGSEKGSEFCVYLCKERAIQLLITLPRRRLDYIRLFGLYNKTSLLLVHVTNN